MSGIQDCGGDVAAYVLGALEPEEAERFRAHMESCAVCRDEASALERVVDALPMAAPQHPVPGGLRRRILSQVHDEARAARVPSRPWGGLQFRPAWTGALAAAVVVAVAIVIAVGSGGSSTHVYRASVGDAQLRVSGGHAELIVNRLPQPASGHIYEVWLKRPSAAAQPTKALFSVTRTGAADIGVPGSLRGVNEVMVTQEPAGGSPVPTPPAVIVAHI